MIFSKKTKSFYQKKIADIHDEDKVALNKEFEECLFFNCTLINCQFKKCKFIDCNFENCLLSAVKLTDCSFFKNNFKNSKIIGIDWTKTTRVDLIKFQESTLDYSNFKQLNLAKIEITDCQAEETDFSETNLSEAILTGTNFKRAIFDKTNLKSANLSKAKNYSIDPRFNQLKNARFSFPEVTSLLKILKIKIENLE